MKRKIATVALTVLTAVCVFGAIFVSVKNVSGIGFNVGDRFTKSEKRYELIVDAAEGGTVDVTDAKYTSGDLVSLKATPKDGYVFGGWYDVDGNYLTTALTYSFTITENTKLNAKFFVKAEDIEGEAKYFEQLRNCAEDFSFSVKCDKENAEEWLAENLNVVDSDLVGTEYENHDGAKVKFTVEKIGDGEYLIKPETGYAAGSTYVASFSADEDGAEFSDGAVIDEEQNDLTFSIVKEETNVVEIQEGIIYITPDEVVELIDDGKAAGDEGDIEDKVVLRDVGDIAIGSIICICTGEKDSSGEYLIDENAIYGKCEKINRNGENYEVVYGTPDLAEIYSELDIYMNRDIDFEESGAEITDETIEEIKHAMLSNCNVQDYVEAMGLAVEEELKNKDEYDVEPLKETLADRLVISVKPKIEGKSASVNVIIGVNFPIKNKKGVKVAQVDLRMIFDKKISVNATFNYQIKRWWFIPIGIESYDFNSSVTNIDDFRAEVKVSYSGEDFDPDLNAAKLKKSCFDIFNSKSFKGRKPSDFKKVLADNKYSADTAKKIRLFSIRHYFGVLSFNFDVYMFADFNIAGTAYFVSHDYSYSLAGVRSSNGSNPRSYKERYGSSKVSEFCLAGEIENKTGAGAEVYLSILGLAKYMRVGAKVETGVYVDMSGYVVLSNGYYAGKLEVGSFFSVSVYLKLFSIYLNYDFVNEKYPVAVLGNDTSYISWAYGDVITAEDYALSLVDVNGKLEDYALFESPELYVNAFSAGGEIGTVAIDYGKYKKYIEVVITGGEYLTFNLADGTLDVTADAPLYFEDYIKITVVATNWFGDFKNGGFCSYLKPITIKIVYGDEDAYYNSTDSEIEREYRSLYKSYNDENGKILTDMFNKLVDKNLDDKIKEFKVYASVVDEYLNALFENIAELKRTEKVGSRANENSFVYGEAGAFTETLKWINEVADSDLEFDEASVADTLIKLEKTTALYNTVLRLENRNDYGDLKAKFVLSDELREKTERALELYKNKSQDAARSALIVEKLKNLFGI